MLDTIFKKFNLKKVHAQVYLSLLEDGPATAGSLAKKLNIPRSTLYGFLYDLIQKGLVKQSEKYNIKIWQAEPPEKINGIVDEKINALEQTKENFNEMLLDLKNKQKTDFINPNFKYYEGSEGIKQLFKSMLVYRDIITDSFWPIKDMIEVLGPDLFIYLNKRRIKQNIYVKALWPESRKIDVKKNIFMGEGEKFKREIRIAPKGVYTVMGYWAFEDKVVLISSRHEAFGFLVESFEFRQMLKTQFDLIWQMSKPYKVDLKYTEKFLEDL